jgi:arsenate reductase-like glutaredoxin family protein
MMLHVGLEQLLAEATTIIFGKLISAPSLLARPLTLGNSCLVLGFRASRYFI